MWQYNYSDEYLCHWGIKGMKWGVRRFQNEDGSLTPQGRARYSDDSSSKKNAVNFSSKSISEMSDEELQSTIRRKQAEKQLRDLMASEIRTSSPEVKKGNGIIKKVLTDAGSQAFTTMTKGAILYVGSKAIEKAFNNPELGKAVATGSMSVNQEKKKD